MNATKSKRKTTRIMWATKAIHKLGDISRIHRDYCVVRNRPVNGNYIGCWVTGFGFCEVKFPVETTHGLTRAESIAFRRKKFGIL